MFKYMMGYNDMRLATIDHRDATGKKIHRLARRIANAEYDGKDSARQRLQLRQLFDSLTTDALNHLAVMYMIVPVTQHMGATGAGGIWAKASEVCNQVAREALSTRPMFEIA